MTKRIEHLSNVLNQFWKRWRNEYLAELWETHRHLGKAHGSPQVSIGDMVIVCEEGLPQSFWKLGRIQHLITGKDGITWVATVRVEGGDQHHALCTDHWSCCINWRYPAQWTQDWSIQPLALQTWWRTPLVKNRLGKRKMLLVEEIVPDKCPQGRARSNRESGLASCKIKLWMLTAFVFNYLVTHYVLCNFGYTCWPCLVNGGRMLWTDYVLFIIHYALHHFLVAWSTRLWVLKRDFVE